MYGKFYDVLDIQALPPQARVDMGPKEGRPDIVHRSVLSVTDHPLFLMGHIEFYVHTLDGRIFRLSKEVKPPRNYIRFLGLMSKLLNEGWVGPSEDEPLIWEVNERLRDLIGDQAILLEESGEFRDPLAYFRDLARREDISIMVGGFPKGSFSDEVISLAKSIFSLYRGVLSSSTALSMILTYLYYLEVWE
ncbi:MAG: 16S rRNA methyltransferase [Candidatus Korarchaeota archaeon]|nr:16S rRNA methyltransferase [Candidatus Korarchaeota archaeon]